MAINLDAILKISQVVIPDIGKQLSQSLDTSALRKIEDTFKQVLGPASSLATAIASIGKESQQSAVQSRVLGNVLGSIFKGTDVRPAITTIAALREAISQLGNAETRGQFVKLEATVKSLSKKLTSELGGKRAGAETFVKDLVKNLRLEQGVAALNQGTKEIKKSLAEREKIVESGVRRIQEQFARGSLAEQKTQELQQKFAEESLREEEKNRAKREQLAKTVDKKVSRIQQKFVDTSLKERNAQLARDLAERERIINTKVKDIQAAFARESLAEQRALDARNQEVERRTRSLGQKFARESLEEAKRLKERTKTSEAQGRRLTQRFGEALAENRPLDDNAIPLAPARKKPTPIIQSQQTAIDTISTQATLAEKVAAREVRSRRTVNTAIKSTTNEYIQLINIINKAADVSKRLGKAQSTDLRLLQTIARERKDFIDSRGQAGVGRGGDSPTGLSPSDVEILKNTVKEQTRLNNELARGSIDAKKFGEQAGLAAKRFGAFIIGSAGIYAFINALRQGIREAILFESEMTKIEQLLDTTPAAVKPIGDEIRRLALETGVSTNEIAKGIETLAQAGITSVDGLKQAANELAKTQLGATFGSIEQTVEGLIAIFGQFKLTIADTGNIINLVNEFSAKFAVESKDVFDAVKRGGAAFAVAGGSFKEFVELFSLLREGSRESANSLGVFFKTGIAKLLGKDSQDLLKKFGIEAEDLIGQLRELATLFDSDKLTRIQKIRLSEQLVGERQFNRLTTLLTQIEDPDIKARLGEVNKNIAGSLDRATVKRIDDFGTSLSRVRESINDVVKSVFESDAIKTFAKNIADLAVGFANVVNKVAPLIPVIATLGTVLALPVFKAFTIGFLEKFGINLGTGGFIGFLKLATSNLREMVVQLRQAITGSQQLASVGGGAVGGGLGRAGRLGRFAAAGAGIAGTAAIAGGLISSFASPDSSASRVGGVLTNAGMAAAIGLTLGGPIGLIIGTLGGILTAALQIQGYASEDRKERFRQKIEVAERRKSPGGLVQASLNELSTTPAFSTFGTSSFERVARFGLFGGPTDAQSFDLNFEKLLNDDPKFKEQKQALIKAIQLINEQEIADIEKQLRSGVFTGTREDAAERLRGVTEGKTRELFDIIRPQGSKPLSDEELKGLIGASGVDFSGSIVTQFRALESQIGNQFRDVASVLNNLFNDIADGLIKVNDAATAQLDALNTIITNPNELVSANASSNNRDLFNNSGFGVINQFQDQTVQWAQQLRLLLDDPAFRGIGTEISDSDQLAKIEQTAQQALEGFSVTDDQIKSLSVVLEQLAAESSQTVDEILTGLAKNRDGVEAYVKSLRGGEEAFARLADSIRQQFIIFNRQRELNRSLTDSLRTLDQAAFDAQLRIEDLSNVLDERVASQSDFVNRTGGTQASRNNANRLLGRTGSAFGNTGQFVQDLFAAINQRNASVNDAAELNRRGFDVNNPAQRGVFDRADADQARLADLQQQLNQRLTEFDRRISSASQAVDILRQAIDRFESDLESAGQSVTQFTITDLGNSFRALDKFIRGGGLASPISGVSNLRDTEFESLQRLLSSLGNIDLGGGLTGASLTKDINQELGITLAAAVRAQTNNQTISEAESDIRNELKALRDQQAAAAAIEAQLRQEQISLLQAQSQLIPIEQQFYRDQISILTQIANSFTTGPLDEIRQTVTRLFRDALLVTEDPKTAERQNQILEKIKSPLKSIPAPNSTQPFTPQIRQPNVPRSPNDIIRPLTPRINDPRDFDTPPFPKNPSIPNRAPTIPRATYPEFYPDQRSPRPSDLRSGTFEFGPQGGLDGLRPLITDVARKIDEASNKIVDAIVNRSVTGNNSNFTLEVSPIQVNVALTAPDILKLAGNQLLNSILAALVPPLAEALGVASLEAKNVFESNVPRQL